MSDIVSGLFGPSPDQVAQQQYLNQQAAAARYAQQAPFERAAGQLYQAGGMLAPPVASALGVPLRNPQIEEAQARQSALSGIDMTNPQAILDYADRVGDPRLKAQLQMMAVKRHQEMQKAAQESNPFAKVNPKDYTPESLREFGATGDHSRLVAVSDEGKVSTEARRLMEMGLQPGTPEFTEKMREWVQSDIIGKAKGAGTTINMPGAEKAIDVPKLRNDIRKAIDKPLEILGFADSALATLDLAIKTNNPSAFQSSRVQLAGAAGGGNISIKEIEAAGGDPSLFGALTDKASVWATGTPSVDTQKKMVATVKAIRKVAAKKARQELDAQAKILNRAGYSGEEINDFLTFPEIDAAQNADAAPASSGPKTRILKSGKTVIVED